jgi:pimeloyl-ACP methyl ester carboxylesterase
MKKILLPILLLSLSLLSFSQRTLPYPIILVHGLGGGAVTWDKFNEYLSINASLSIETQTLDYCLNSDNSKYNSEKYNDVSTYGNWRIGDKDIYTVNFNTCSLSNESAIVKQGYALRFAIQRVLSATGADKVILLGHSMGGLAIREYLQNPSNWQNDGGHHVAKLVTIGTPHGGSDLGSGGLNIGDLVGVADEKGEAVRDLRNTYATSRYYDSGIYLFGGYESRKTLTTNLFGSSSYYNIDVDCNGSEGNYVVGLNQKNISNDLAFSCVIGGPTISDGVVLSSRQNLNNYYNIGAEIFNYYCNGDFNCHRNEPKKATFEMMYALDEPSYDPHQYGIEFNKSYSGFFTVQPNGSTVGDVDAYTFYVPQKGKITLSANLHPDANGQAIIQSPNSVLSRVYGSSINGSVDAPSGGTYRLIFSGNSGNGWRGYNYSLSFCSYLDTPSITSSNATTFCEGNYTTLSVPSGFEAYQWYKDGVKVGSNSTQLQVSQVGTYTLDAYKCGNTNKTSNSIKITVNPNPAKPDLQTEEKPLLFTLKTSSTENINWVLNGNTISSATTKNYVPQKGGNYSILASKGSCFAQSDVITIPDAPTLTALTNTTFCDGDSLRIKANVNVDTYRWYRDSTKLANVKSELVVKQTGTYRAVLQSGKGMSIPSAAVKITVNPNPSKPDLQTEEKPLLFTLKTSSNDNINWLLNGNAISSATTKNYVPQKGGIYSVLASKGSCFSQSDVITIPDAPTLIALTNTTFCDGDSLRIKANINVDTYRWYRDSTKLSNVKSELVAKQTGTYRAVLQSGKGLSIPSIAIAVKAKPSPAKPLIANDIKPEQFTLTSSSAVNNQWYFNNVAINSANQQSHVPEQVGSYVVRVTNDDCFSNSEAIKIFIDKPVIELTSKNPACDSILLRTSKGFGAYRWNIGGQALNTSSNEIVVKKSGNISLNIGRGKISSPQSDIVGIFINPTPSKPIITLTDDLEIPSLKSSYLLGNQWYLLGTKIDGATDQFLRNLIYGEYKVSTTQLGCTNISEPFKVALSDDVTFTEKTKVYPNPSSGEFKVEVPFSNITNISVYGINGIEYTNSIVNSFNRGKEMNVFLPSGAYLIKIVADGKEVVKKFMINR